MRAFFLAFLLLAMLRPAFATEHYICGMHPHIHGEKGDRCPICGMELIPAPPPSLPKKDEHRHDAVPSEGSIGITPEYMQALGIRSGKAVMHEFGKTVEAYGRIIPSSRAEYRISPRKGGWIRDLHASATGDRVKKGDVLFTFYSPDIISAQTEYITALRTNFRPAASEQRLRLFGMDEQAIALFRKKGAVIEDVPFHAPADGAVALLDTRKGAFMEEGSTIMVIQDFSQVWVEAHVPVKDLRFLRPGDAATVTVAQSGESYETAVDYVYPTADVDSREGMVRLVLENPDGKLKTDLPVDVMLMPQRELRLAVPEEAVLRGGMGAYVFKDLGDGSFRPVMVKTGITSDGMTEILSGLNEGQSVVTSGQFMLDAESALRGGMANMQGHDHGQ